MFIYNSIVFLINFLLENVLTKRTNEESIQAIGDNIAYSCYPCNKNFSNDKYYKQHCSGKKH